MTFVVRRTLPESPYYLARTGRRDDAARVLTKITGRPVAAAHLDAPQEARSSIRELFTRSLARADALMIGVWVALNISYYGLFLWLPFVLNGDKFTIDLYLLLTLSALSQFPGYAAAIWLVERIGRKPTLAAFLLLGGLSGYSFAAADSATVYVISLFFVGFFNLGAWGVVYTYTPEMYPTRLRGTGAGWAAACGRVFAFLAPLSIAYQIAVFGGDQTVFVVFTVVMVLGGLVVLALGPETRGRSLEEVAGG
jgi:putative MFS transporter